MYKTIDIEDALRLDLSTLCKSLFFTCLPIPENLGENLPLVVIERLGGERISNVIDTHAISLDVYAETWKDATNYAGIICGVIPQLMDTPNLSFDYLDSEVSNLPYNNTDPEHKNIPRVSFSVSVSTRTI